MLTTTTEFVRKDGTDLSIDSNSKRGRFMILDPVLTAERYFEIGKLYFDRCEFGSAIQNLQKAADEFAQRREFSRYLDCQNLLIRVYSEQDEFDKVQIIKERLQDLVLKEGLELNSKTFYVLGVCSVYKDQMDLGLDYFQKALALALTNDDKIDICYAISGIAGCYSKLGRDEDALKEIGNLDVFFQFMNLPEIRVSALILRARILTDSKQFDEAIDILWQAYEMLKVSKVLNQYAQLLYNFARTYYAKGDLDLARIYLNLAQKSTDEKNLVRLAKSLSELVSKVGLTTQDQFDLIFDFENHSVFERKLGKVDFKNQFILLDLLKLFVQNQGQIYSKEFLVENIWKQDYDPLVHDNKIYVTIKRLRKMIEPDFEKPRYIFRAKNGYYMNKAAKVHIEKRGGNA